MRHSASRTMLTHARTCAGKQLTRALARASSSHAICDASSERTRREECLGGAIGVGGAQARGLPTTRSASTRAHARDALCSGDAFARARGRGVSARGFASATTGEEGASAAATVAETLSENSDGETTTTSSGEDAQGWTFGIKNQRRPTRRDKGSYEGFLTEIDSYPNQDDEIRDVYNAREWVETSIEESMKETEELIDQMLDGLKSGNHLMEKYGDLMPSDRAEEGDPDAVLTWTSEFVLEPGEKQEHPLNWKVSVTVKMTDLQRVTGLSDDAIEYIKLLVNKRYDGKQDTLRIVCRRNNNREHNRQWCLKVLYDLIQEGNREYPSESYTFNGTLD
jgi:hypothetical protein